MCSALIIFQSLTGENDPLTTLKAFHVENLTQCNHDLTNVLLVFVSRAPFQSSRKLTLNESAQKVQDHSGRRGILT